MGLKQFLHHLQFDPDVVKPPDWEADWEDAPLPYKLYRGLPAIPLSAEMPLTMDGAGAPAEPDLCTIGHFLWYVYGLTQVSQSVFVPDPAEQPAASMQMYRRFVPSGGGLYPCELYIYLKLKELPAGVYHYDAAHHRLVLLREGDFDAYLNRALGNRCEVSASFGVAFVSVMFWKNSFKYNNFSYRLQGLDTGVLIGQLLEVAKRFEFSPCVCFQFLDRAVNHLLGLSEQAESVYAVIPLSAEHENDWFANRNAAGIATATASELCGEMTAIRHDYYIRSQRVVEFPVLVRMNEASMLDSVHSFRQIGKENSTAGEPGSIILPRVKRMSYDLASACRKRYSPESDFVLCQIGLQQLASLLQEATASFSYRNDLDGELEKAESRVSLYGCFYGVEGVPDGAYRYDGASHALSPVRPGDHRSWLQQGMSLHNINLFQVPLIFHVVGEAGHLQSQLGYRGYRTQQMEAGMLVQRLLLAASAVRMGGRPLLGFDANTSDEIYKLTPCGKTSLIQVPLGPYRGIPRLVGSLSR